MKELIERLYNSLESVTYRDRHYKHIKIWDKELEEARQVIEGGNYSIDIKELVKQSYSNALQQGLWKKTTMQDAIKWLATEVIELSGELVDELPPIYYVCESRGMICNKLENIRKYCGQAKPCGYAIELADIVILAASIAGKLDIDIEEAIRIKMEYNKTRNRDTVLNKCVTNKI